MNTLRLMKKIILIILLITPINLIQSQVIITPGIVCGTWTKDNSPYLVDGNIIIPRDSSLTINAGVTVEFLNSYSLTVYGTLKVAGEVSDSVRFTSSDSETGWYGIKIIGPSTDTIHIRYGIIENVIGSTGYYGNDYGAIKTDSNAILIIDNSKISHNINSYYGCGIYSSMSTLFINNCYFKDNDGGQYGGAIYSDRNKLYINYCKFISNNCLGPGYSSAGGAINSYGDSILYIVNSDFTQNAANYGGSIRVEYCDSVILRNNTFLENSGFKSGGALYFTESKGKVINNLICNNTAPSSSTYSDGGGGITLYHSNVMLINNTIANNTDYGLLSAGSNSIIINTIFSENLDAYLNPSNVNFYDYGAGMSSVKFINCVLDGGIDAIVDYIGPDDTINCFNESPAFLDPENNMFQVNFNSVIYNNGTSDTTGLKLPPSDLAGIPRVIDDTVDIGAYEFNHTILNRVPKIAQLPDFAIRPNDSITLSILYTDADLADTHTIRIYSSDTLVKINGPTGHVSGSTFLVVPDPDISTTAQIIIVVTDNSGTANASDSIMFDVNVMKTFDLIKNGLVRDMVWKTDTIRIFQSTWVDRNVLLDIRPGTYVEFQGQYRLYIRGQILAQGTKVDPIHFALRPDLPGMYWDGIRFMNNIYSGSNPPDKLSVLDHCIIENAFYGLYLQELKDIQISNCEIKNCMPGIYCQGGATIENCSIHDCSGVSQGSGLYLNDYGIGSIQVSNCSIYNNSSSESGGGIYCSGEKITIAGNLIYDNYAPNGGGIYALGIPCFLNNTIAFNSAQKGGAMYQYPSGIVSMNNIFQYNSASQAGNQIYSEFWGRYTYLYNNYIEGGLEDIFVQYGNSEIRAGNNYYTGTTFINAEVRNFNLTSSSICINAGSLDSTLLRTIDQNLIDELIMYDDRIDIGAIEFIGIPENRLPIIERTDLYYIRKDTVSSISIDYLELDADDSVYAEIHSPDTHIQIRNAITKDSKLYVEVEPETNWSGVVNLIISILDRTGTKEYSNTDTIEIHVSNTHEYCGTFLKDMVWNGDTVLIGCDVIIEYNAVLTIAKNTFVKFTGPYSLVIKGILIADGQKDTPITFTSSGINWAGILLERADEYSSLKEDTSYIRYCILENTEGSSTFQTYAGLTLQRGLIKLENTIIRNNTNCGIVLENGDGTIPIIRGNIIRKNNGSGLVITGSPEVSDNIFEENGMTDETGNSSAAITIKGGRPYIHNNIIRFNKSGSISAGQFGYGINTTISNNFIYSNSSEQYNGCGISISNLANSSRINIVGNVIYDNHNISSEGGGILIAYTSNSEVFVSNNTIIKNTSAILGGGIYFGRNSSATLKNNILWGNTTNEATDQIGYGDWARQVHIANCLIEYGMDSLHGWEDGFTNIDTSNIYRANPQFKDYEHNYFNLMAISPCINTGTSDTTMLCLPKTDIKGNPRITDGRIDIGAYEYKLYDCSDSVYHLAQEICSGDSLYFIDRELTDSGHYYFFYQSSAGCDSVIVLDLRVNPLPYINLGPDITVDDNEQYVVSVDDIYKEILWMNGSVNNQISVSGNDGETVEVWVAVTDSMGCTNYDTLMIYFENQGSDNIESTAVPSLKVFPNPSTGMFKIWMVDNFNSTAELSVVDLNGLIIFREKLTDSRHDIDLTFTVPGIYLLIVQGKSFVVRHKLIIY